VRLLLVGPVLASLCLTAAAQAPCLPEDLKLNAVSGAASVKDGGEPHGAAVVYLDASLSMRGFVDPRAGQPASFTDTIVGLRQMLEQSVPPNAIAFNTIGANVTPLTLNGVLALTRSVFYVCDQAHRDGCETRLDKVFAAVASSDGDTVSVLETDLFLSEQDMVGSELGTMRNSLERVLLSGKSIGILGISAPFYGFIYDIPRPPNAAAAQQKRRGAAMADPVGRTISYEHRGERPFFLLIMGSDDRQILRLRDKIEEQLLSGLPPQNHHFALFTLHPARTVTTTVPRLLDDQNKVIPAYRKLPAKPEGIPVVEVTAKDPPRIREQANKFQESADASALADFAVGKLELWGAHDNIISCQARQWNVWQQAGLITAESGGGDLVVRFESAGLRNMLPKPFTYLVHATVVANGVKGAPEQTGWLHDWSFSAAPDDVNKVLKSRPQLFPVLNLGLIGDTLAGIVRSDFKPVPVTEYVLAFQRVD
jgi:hypothetical protein